MERRVSRSRRSRGDWDVEYEDEDEGGGGAGGEGGGEDCLDGEEEEVKTTKTKMHGYETCCKLNISIFICATKVIALKRAFNIHHFKVI